jgi:hypothetical protein
MRKPVGLIAIASLAASSSTLAGTPCPKVGYTYPWVIDELMPGDEYADVNIDINRSGLPLACRIGQTNMEKDNWFWVCNAFMEQFRTKPPVELAKGERTTVQRRFVAYGAAHLKAERKAKKEFFRQHPSERPECYAGGE